MNDQVGAGIVNFRVAKPVPMGKAIALDLSQVSHPDFCHSEFKINSAKPDQRIYNIHKLIRRI
jgi:hypothetical protein